MLALLLLACAPADKADDTAPGASPGYHTDVAPILARSCVGCHTDGGAGPFPLDDHESAAAYAGAMVSAVEAGTMPPFYATETEDCAPPAGWRDDIRLSDAEKATLRAWADAGAPEGPPADDPLPEPPETTLTTADQEVYPDEGVTLTELGDSFVCTSVDPGLVEDAFLTGLQVLPGIPAVVHHVLVFSDPEAESATWDGAQPDCHGTGVSEGALIGVYVPGATPFRTPEGSGIEVTAGSRIVMQIHYHAAAAPPEPDRTGIALDWADTTPSRRVYVSLLGNAWNEANGLLPGPNDRTEPEFRIPAGVVDHTESMALTMPDSLPELDVFAVGAHMHLIADSMEVRLSRADGSEDCLLHDAWDYDWQRVYQYDEATGPWPTVAGGDTVRLECNYDNTLDNPGVARALAEEGLDEPVDVGLGSGTLDEMCLAVFGVMY